MSAFIRRVAFSLALAACTGLAAAQPPKPEATPSAAEIKAAVESLKDVYDKYYAAAEKQDLDKLALAKRLLEAAPKRKTPAMIFACYDEARRLAAAGGDAKLALGAIDELN